MGSTDRRFPGGVEFIDTESRRVLAPGCREGSGGDRVSVLKDKECSGDGWWCDGGCSTL